MDLFNRFFMASILNNTAAKYTLSEVTLYFLMNEADNDWNINVSDVKAELIFDNNLLKYFKLVSSKFNLIMYFRSHALASKSLSNLLG